MAFSLLVSVISRLPYLYKNYQPQTLSDKKVSPSPFGEKEMTYT